MDLGTGLKRRLHGPALLDMSVGIPLDEDYMARDGDVMNYRRLERMEPRIPGVPQPICETIQDMRPTSTTHGHTFHYVRPTPTCSAGS